MKLGKATDGPVSRLINRRISHRITSFLVKHCGSPDPNQVTILTTLIGVLAGLSFLFLDVWIAGILAQLSSILDGVDGEIARLSGRTSKRGGFLDAVMDRIVDISIIWGLAIFMVRQYIVIPLEILLSIVLFTLSGSLMVSYFNARGEASLGVHPRKLGSIPLATRDVRIFTIFLGCIFQPFYFWSVLIAFLVIGFLSYVFVFANLVIVWRNYHEDSTTNKMKLSP